MFQLFGGLIVFSWLFCANEEYKFDKPEYYEDVIGHFEQNRVAHFPKQIPKNAKNVEMNGWFLSLFGSEGFFLKFDIDKKYIENELNKYKFIGIENFNKHERSRNIYPYQNGNTFKLQDFTYYVISDMENDKPTGRSFPYHYGMAINQDKTQIIYYYSDPD